MPSRIDHVIVAAADLDALEGVFTRLGFHVTGGGTHPHLGTRNRIIVLGKGYIELLGVADQQKASLVLTHRLLAGTPAGWVGVALRSHEIASETEAMRARGVDARGPLPGRLVAPDGTARGWRVTMIGGEDVWAAEPLPFLIQHDAEGEEHQRRLDEAGEGVCAVVVAVQKRRAAEDVLRGKGVGSTSIGDTIWIDERDTLGVSLALASE